MRAKNEFQRLVADLLSDLGQVDVLWQLAALAASLGLAWWISRRLRSRIATEAEAWKFGAGGLNRVLFPLSALLLALLGRAMLRDLSSVNLLNLAVPLLVSLAIVRVAVYLLRHALAPSSWLSGSERIVGGLVWIGFALHITGLLPDIAEFLNEVRLPLGKYRISLLLILQAVLSVLVTLLAALWLGRMLEARIMKTEQVDLNLRIMLSKLLRSLLVVMAVIIALPAVGIDLTVLSVFGGALGVGLGFGLQKIASNYISGFIILMDRSVGLGDMVMVDNRYGKVVKMSARYVVLRAMDGTEAIIPNETLITSTVVNETYSDARLRIGLPIQVGYDSDLPAAMGIMKAAASRHPRVLSDPAPAVLVKRCADNGIDLELWAVIEDPDAGKNNLVSDLYLEILKEFKTAGVSIPYPQRDVRIVGGPPLASPPG